MKGKGMFFYAAGPGGRDDVLRPAGYFIVALGAAVILHLLFMEFFLLVFPSKDFRSEKGFTFLGSILDSSQMEGSPFISRVSDTEKTVFSSYVPPRSERRYFESLKDVEKPENGAFGNKRDIKSLFPAAYRKPGEKDFFQWHPGDPVEYQPLRFQATP